MPASRSYSEQICHNNKKNENEMKISLGRLFCFCIFFVLFISFSISSQFHPGFVPISSRFRWILCLAFWRSYFNKLIDAGLLYEFIRTFFALFYEIVRPLCNCNIMENSKVDYCIILHFCTENLSNTFYQLFLLL